jgi:protein-tyrosine-phosphatase
VLGDKRRTTELARSLGIPVPREQVVSSMDEAGELRGRFHPPLIVKPPASYSLDDVDVKRMVRRARSWPEAERFITDAFADGPAVVQEFLPGRGVGLELLVREGEPVLAFQHARLHEPLEGGGSTYRESVPVSPGLLDAATRLLGELAYTGVAMAEFRVDPATGRSALLEVNARFWGSLPLAVAAGADFPRALFELLVDGETHVTRTYRTGLRTRNLRADLKWHYQNLRADRTDPTLESRPWPGVVRETLESVLGGRERSDTFTVDDPGPGFAEMGQLGGELVRELRLRADRVRARTSPRYRRRLREAAADALRSSRSVLFVCRGNIARSPFAAALVARQLPDGHEVRSAGFLPAGRVSPPAAVAAAELWDVDLSGHRSQALTPELVEGSDAIFVFDGRNLTDLLSRHPEARERVHLVGALDDDDEILIPDPLPRGDGAFRAAYERIAAALTASRAER